MSRRRWFGWSMLGVATLGLAWACQDSTPPITEARFVAGKVAFDASSPPALQPGVLWVCKDTPAGTSGVFMFEVTGVNLVRNQIKSGQCVAFYKPAADGSFSVNENLSLSDDGWLLVGVTMTTTTGGTQELTGNGPFVCSVSLTLGTGCILVFHNSPTATGRMTGGGSSIDIGDVRITKGLTIHCDITLSNNLEINWGGNHWHLDKPIDSAQCIDDPAIEPAPPPAPFDTFIGTATGQLNGVDGSRCEFTFVDAGEPGGKNDRAGIKIWDAGGNLVLDLPLTPTDGGNLQAHYDQPHGSHAPK